MNKNHLRLGILNVARISGLPSNEVLKVIAAATGTKLRTDSVRASITTLCKKFRRDTFRVVADKLEPLYRNNFALASARIVDVASIQQVRKSNYELFKHICSDCWYPEIGFGSGSSGTSGKKTGGRPKSMPRKLFNNARGVAKSIRLKMRKMRKAKEKPKVDPEKLMSSELETFVDRHAKLFKVKSKYKGQMRKKLLREIGLFAKLVGVGRFKRALKVVLKTPKVAEKYKKTIRKKAGMQPATAYMDAGGYMAIMAGIGSATVLTSIFISIYWKELLALALIAVAAVLISLIVRTVFKFGAKMRSKLKRRTDKKIEKTGEDKGEGSPESEMEKKIAARRAKEGEGGPSDEKKDAARKAFKDAKNKSGMKSRGKGKKKKVKPPEAVSV